MTDTDRLRAAADLMEKRCPCSEHWATAALLRAVAARHVSDSDGERCFNCRESWPCSEAAAALILADAILGGSDE